MSKRAEIQTTLVVFAILLTMSGCTADSGSRESVELKDSSKFPEPGDSSVADTFRDSADAGSVKQDTDSESEDAGGSKENPYAGCPLSQAMAEASYVCEPSSNHTVSYRTNNSDYDKPSHPPSTAPTTLQREREHFGGSLPQNASSIGFGSELEPLRTHDAAYAEWGDDVTLHIATIHPRSSYSPDARIVFTALLNYKPTELEYRHYSDDRSKVLKKSTGTSFEIPIDGPTELVDITVPAEVFDRRGRYDLAFGWAVNDAIKFSESWSSKHIYYGGCSPPPHLCAKPVGVPTGKEATKKIYKGLQATGYVHPVGELAGENPLEPIEVDGGQTVEIEYAILPITDFATTWMLVPMIDGTPLDKRQHVLVPEYPDGKEGFRFGGPGRFEVEIPEKPGRYEVEVATWNLPFLSESEKTTRNLAANFASGTNSLFFVVKE